jgi:hypothetical protein
MNSNAEKEMNRLLRLFQSLQSDADRIAFQTQWQRFLSSLSDEDRRTAVKALSSAVTDGLRDFVHTLQTLTPQERAAADEFLATIPTPDEITKKVSIQLFAGQ